MARVSANQKKDANHSLFFVSQGLRLSMESPVIVCSPITYGLCKRTSMQKRHRDTHESADLASHALDGLCAHKRHRPQRRECVRNVEASSFDRLPDELVLAILVGLDDPRALAVWAQTSRRHHRLADDPFVWRRLCELRFGPLLYRQFSQSCKDWHWLYRAQAHVAATVGADVGAVLVHARKCDYVYWGDCLDGRPHGYGLAILLPTRHCEREHALTRVLPTSATPLPEEASAGYEGMWDDGRMCGHGVYTTSDGYRYDGLWRDGKRAGHGTATSSNGTHYVGLWADDARSGYGTCTYSDGERYEGDWTHDQSNGRGVCTWPDGERHEGNWKRDKCDGWGVRIYPSGDRYEGDWKGNVRAGWGVHKWANGTRYEGQFRDDKRGGYGVCLYVSGARYVGHWYNDRPNGHGVYTWPSGACYNGEFRNGKRDGRGTYVYADNERHEGRWKNDARYGHGATTFGNGDHYAGDHTDGKFNGHGVYTWADGTRYDGQWQHGKADGAGARHYPDGSCARGQWAGRGLVSGEVTCHRTGGTPCCNGARCAACVAVVIDN